MLVSAILMILLARSNRAAVTAARTRPPRTADQEATLR